MHLRGCYDWFRKPPTEYEKWQEQHQWKKARREMKEAKRQRKEEAKLKRYREEMERRREEIRRQGNVLTPNSILTFELIVHLEKKIEANLRGKANVSSS
jgi:hypothetical protein